MKDKIIVILAVATTLAFTVALAILPIIATTYIAAVTLIHMGIIQ